MLDVVTGVEEQFTLTIEGQCVARLVDLVSSFEILLGTLCQFSLGGPDDLVQVVNLAEAALWLLIQQTAALHCGQLLLLK